MAMSPGCVRPLRDEDLTAVAALRRRCFRQSQQPDLASLESRLRAVFLGSPWRGRGVESLVYEDGQGRVLGFRGLLARPMRFRGEPILVAVSSQYMVDPEARTAGVALALMRATLAGPQDLLFSDSTNAGAAALWKSARGTEITELSLHWSRPLQPMRWVAGKLGAGRNGRWVRRLAAPLIKALDTLASRDAAGPFRVDLDAADGLRTTELSLAAHAAHLRRLDGRYELVPDYDEDTLRWTLDRLTETLGPGQRLTGRNILDDRGEARGFFLASFRTDATAQVLQLEGDASCIDGVLATLLDSAAKAGCVEVTGRLQPAQLGVVARPPACLSLGPPRFLAFSRRPELIESLRSDRAWLSRLEGEWWMGF